MTLTTGLELELWVVDENGRLCDGRRLADAHERIEPEFVAPLLEVQTAPRSSPTALGRDLEDVLGTAIRAARAAGKRLVPLGTPLTECMHAAHTERGDLFERIYGDGVRAAKNCAGTHLHFERAEPCRQLNLLTALDPALALVSSAPYYCGERSRRSARAHAYRRDCGTAFAPFCDLWSYADSVAEWKDRVDRAHDTFVSLAAERGVDPAAVEASFAPEDTVLNPVRLRRGQPTVEWRAPDSALPSEVLSLAAEVGRLVEQTTEKPVVVGEPGVRDDRIGIPAFDDLYDLSRVAINFGLAPEPVRDYLERLTFDCSAYDPLAERLGESDSISESRACEIRLEQAHRLEADVAGLQDVEPSPPGRAEEA
jgi:hypothetical protein